MRHIPVHIELTPAAEQAITVAQAKAHLGIATEDTSHDVELGAFIRAATRAVERHCDLVLISTEFQANTPVFEAVHTLRKRPFHEFVRMEYVRNSDGEIVTVDTALYHTVHDHDLRHQVHLGKGLKWPADGAQRNDAVRYIYKAGWENAAAVPDDIKTALLMTVAKLDATRGDCDEDSAQTVFEMKNTTAAVIPKAAVALLDSYTLKRLSFA